MSADDLSLQLLAQLKVVRRMASDMRFGQMLATLGLLAEDMTGRGLWEIEDEELLAVIERFRQDLARREESIA
ncbi:MAG: hypothetical protein KY476_18835 [Planctomycetes bacterium]|nr:hypothetical protein [Planctomycetota bacterium]